MQTAILFVHDGTEGSLAFKVNNTKTYEDAYLEIKDKLESPEIIAHIIESQSLLWDLFEGDKTYKFKKSFWANYQLNILFVNDFGDAKHFRAYPDFIKTL
jgi:hypothetical protein